MKLPVQGELAKCDACGQPLGKRVVDKQSPLQKCLKCGGIVIEEKSGEEQAP